MKKSVIKRFSVLSFACLSMIAARAQSEAAVVDSLHNFKTNATDYYCLDADSLHLQPMTTDGRVISPMLPLWAITPTYDLWPLHEGMNVSLSAYVTAAFGRHAPSGAGFGQNIGMMYALPIGQHLSIAAGGYLNNFTWGGASYRDVGISGMLSYRFNNHWEAAIYGNKSLANRYSSPLYRMSPAAWALPYDFGDRIGASLTYNVSPSFSVQLSVERVSLPKNDQSFQPQHNDR